MKNEIKGYVPKKKASGLLSLWIKEKPRCLCRRGRHVHEKEIDELVCELKQKIQPVRQMFFVKGAWRSQ
jgi:hypothetical protein